MVKSIETKNEFGSYRSLLSWDAVSEGKQEARSAFWQLLFEAAAIRLIIYIGYLTRLIFWVTTNQSSKQENDKAALCNNKIQKATIKINNKANQRINNINITLCPFSLISSYLSMI